LSAKIGIDTGGTFTDFVWLDPDGRWQIHKQLSTPDDPSAAILSGLTTAGVPAETGIVHGSTVATNALLERRGARTALITTAGFADVLAIGRQNRPDLYALVPQKPPPLIPTQWRFSVPERLSAKGEVIQVLDMAAMPPILDRMAQDQVQSVAIVLLFSFLDPTHEQALRDWLVLETQPGGRYPELDLHISLSADILPEYREYERTATTVINAYVAPLMSRYLDRLATALKPRPVTVMQSNGGVIGAATAGIQAARTVLSGPAGGVVGAQYVAGQAGHEQIITFDMGGTSTDVALCPGRLPTTTRGEIAGLPLRLPIIDIHTVGAGGGSLALVDPGGALHVGPASAGAYPGPVSYDIAPTGPQGHPTWVTTTDANLVLGRLDADHFLGGKMSLNRERAEASLAVLAREMGAAGPQEAAAGVIQVANATMERAVRRISVERGYDPRRFTLVAFGGAGPLHACELAGRLQIPRVLVPPVPGVLSALGMLVAAPTKDVSRTVMLTVDDEDAVWAQLQAGYRELADRAQAAMAAEGHDPSGLTLHHLADMRYAGQSHELPVTLPAGRVELTDLFHQAHENRYGYRQHNAPVVVVTLRVRAVAPVAVPALPAGELGTEDAAAAIIGQKTVWFAGEPHQTTLYDRTELRPGHRFSGPVVVFQYDTTTVIPPSWTAQVDRHQNLILQHEHVR
jgi:N-methylhydantoinase A